MDISCGNEGKHITNSIFDIFRKYFDQRFISSEASRVIKLEGKVVYTTNSFVANPIFFKGGDIGKLAVCCTVNELSMMGAVPKFMTAGFIIDEDCEPETLDKIARSMATEAKEAKVKIVAGDIKLVKGSGGIYINTSGIGEIVRKGFGITNCKLGDVLILTGNLGDHHAAIMSARTGTENNIFSDCATLVSMIKKLFDEKVRIRYMRGISDGGLAAVLHEIAENTSCRVVIEEKTVPVSKEVRSFCNSLNLDPLYISNEGNMILVLPNNQAEKALSIIRENKYGKNASVIGAIVEGQGVGMRTKSCGSKTVELLSVRQGFHVM